MSSNYEFKHQAYSQKIILYAVRSLLLILIVFFLWILGWSEALDLADQLNVTGSILIGFWAYLNVSQAKHEIQELFVPPFNTLNAYEFVVLGMVSFAGAFFL